ncbi:helix-turn-helix protein [Geodermatophilus tzadiensis]|uniref:Helix-turn-helix protein n=1 Tax=Geodermatophilus tzadiensis TaxID=1137988 RepID=A0A2T0TRC4_9ACTN|nr:helix-turn-helix transcriptional regulator [Geodermatophilus tzadiensis]PRY48226.1 helix-turn-helix protein [Geodermatophilus tzadiensis]
MTDVDIPGLLRRIRRAADWSQRDLARACGLSKSTVAAIESGQREVGARLLSRMAGLAGLRLVLVDAEGTEVAPMDADAVRDEGGRRYPAHLDTRHGDEGWWHGPHRYDRPPVTYTFTRDRRHRDDVRRLRGTPPDHQRPQPGDGLAERAAARRAAARQAREEERRRRLEVGELAPAELGFDCSCPPACDELDDRSGPPRHAGDCDCGCDLS